MGKIAGARGGGKGTGGLPRIEYACSCLHSTRMRIKFVLSFMPMPVDSG